MRPRLPHWRRLAGLASLGAAAAMVVSACGSGDSTATPGAQATAAPTATRVPATATAVPAPTPTPPPTPTATSNVKRGGTLLYPATAPLQTTDPSKLYAFTVHYALGHVWSTLIKYKDREWNDTELEGDLASAWTISPDGKTYTFRMNPEARWQNIAPVNGRKVTSADVKWTWDLENDRIVPNYGSAYRSRWPSAIQSMETPDDATLVIRLGQPFAPMLYGVANNVLKVLPKEVFELDKEFGKSLIGSGAFQFVEASPSGSVKTKASVNYWKPGSDGKALPYLDAVEQVRFGDSAALIAAIKAGQLAFQTPGGITFDQAQDLIKTTPNVVVTRNYQLTIYILRFNQAVKPWENIKARQAVLKGYDKETLLNSIWRQPDAPLYGPIAAGVQGYELAPDEVRQLMKYDLTEAKRLLAEAGAVGTQVKLLAQFQPTDPVQEAVLAFSNQTLNDLGLKSEIFVPPAGGGAGALLLQQKNYSISQGTLPYEGNPWNWIRPNWHSDGSTNFLNLADKNLDKMIDDAEAEIDAAKAQARVKDIQRYIIANAYGVPLPNGWLWIPQQKNLKNYARTWAWGHTGIEHAWLDR